MSQRFKAAHRQSGISYVETLAAVIIIAVSIVPATVAIRGAMNATQLDSRATVNHYRLMSKMEELLAAPFATVFAQAAGPTTATSAPKCSMAQTMASLKLMLWLARALAPLTESCPPASARPSGGTFQSAATASKSCRRKLRAASRQALPALKVPRLE